MNLQEFLELEFKEISYSDAESFLKKNLDITSEANGLFKIVELFEIRFGLRYHDDDYTFYKPGERQRCGPLFHFIHIHLDKMIPGFANVRLKKMSPMPKNHIVQVGSNEHNVCPILEISDDGNFYRLEYCKYYFNHSNPIAMNLFLEFEDDEIFCEILQTIYDKMSGRVNCIMDRNCEDGFHIQFNINTAYSTTSGIQFIKDVISTVWKLYNL